MFTSMSFNSWPTHQFFSYNTERSAKYSAPPISICTQNRISAIQSITNLTAKLFEGFRTFTGPQNRDESNSRINSCGQSSKTLHSGPIPIECVVFVISWTSERFCDPFQ